MIPSYSGKSRNKKYPWGILGYFGMWIFYNGKRLNLPVMNKRVRNWWGSVSGCALWVPVTEMKSGYCEGVKDNLCKGI